MTYKHAHDAQKRVQSVELLLEDIQAKVDALTPEHKPAQTTEPCCAPSLADDVCTMKAFLFHDTVKCLARLHVCLLRSDVQKRLSRLEKQRIARNSCSVSVIPPPT